MANNKQNQGNKFESSGGTQLHEEGHGMVSNLTDKTKEMASNVSDKTKEMASNVSDKTKEMASTVSDKTKEMASDLSDKAHSLATNAEGKTDEALASLGGKITSIAGTLRDKAPTEGALGSTLGTVADKLQHGGEYLSQHGIGDMAEEVTGLIRKYPMQSLWIGVGVGVLLRSVLSSRR